MLVNTHNPESCAFRSDESREAIVGGASKLNDVAAAKGARLEGIWTNRTVHTIFVLLDAHNAHVVDDIIREIGWIGHTDSNVYSVVVMEEAIQSVPRETLRDQDPESHRVQSNR